MPRPIWSGAISFGLVTIPIKVMPATQDRSISFHQYHQEDMGRIRYRKVCEIDGQVLRDDQIGKGYEVSRDQLVEVTDDELDRMPLPTAKAIEIVAFVPADSIDPVRLSDSYYLAADGAVAAKPYVLLREALKRTSKVAVAKLALRGRERLGLLSIKEEALVLHSMKWPDEIRSPESLTPRSVDLDDGEIERAMQLMDSMAMDDLTGLRDEYRDALEQLLDAKADGKRPPAVAGEEQQEGQVLDLMAALEQSVRAARETRGEETGDAPGKKPAAKKKAAKKTAAKKASSKRSA